MTSGRTHDEGRPGRQRPARAAVLLAAGLCLFGSACGSGSESGSTDDPSDRSTSQPTASATVEGGSTDDTDTIVADDVDPLRDGEGLVCDMSPSAVGDVDGDGIGDRVAFDTATSTLVVCTGDQVLTLPGGRGEILTTADLDGNRRDEILTGATTAWGVGLEVAAVVDGDLDYVRVTDGQPLVLWEGLPPGRFLAAGCGSFSDGEQPEVAVVEGSVDDSGAASWQRSVFRVEGHRAVTVLTDEGAFDAAGWPDPLSAPELLELSGEPCWAA